MTGALSDRDLGWLRYLHRKATTPDSWDRDGRPHEHCCAVGLDSVPADPEEAR